MKQSKLSKEYLYRIIISLILILLIICLIINPKRYINSILNGILLWSKVVLPSLLPFLFFTKLITMLNILPSLCSFLSPLINKIFKTKSMYSGYLFFISILSGYPVGSKLVVEYYENGVISKQDAIKINTFTSVSGPLFIIGSVGIGMLNNKYIGYILLFSHILSALITGLFYRNIIIKEDFKAKENKNILSNNFLDEALYNSIISILKVGTLIAIFYLFIDIVNDLKIFYPIIKLFNNYDFNISPLLSGIIEMTRGAYDLSSSAIPIKIMVPLISFLISFGGLCIHFQSYTFLSKIISYKFFLKQKIAHSIISFIITYLLCAILL
jgi:sporulation integral membrane protein YlbJ